MKQCMLNLRGGKVIHLRYGIDINANPWNDGPPTLFYKTGIYSSEHQTQNKSVNFV